MSSALVTYNLEEKPENLVIPLELTNIILFKTDAEEMILD